MNKHILLSIVFVIIAMSLNGMKDDRKKNTFEHPKTLVKIVQIHYGADDSMNQFVEDMFVHIQKTKPEMYKNLVGGIYSQQK